MKILISQAYHEQAIQQLTTAVENNPDIDLFLFPEGYISSAVLIDETRKLANKYQSVLVSSYRDNNKDISLVIDKSGDVIYTRPKTASEFNTPLIQPLTFELGTYHCAYILCMEILKGFRDLQSEHPLDIIFHPIGVGMFSNEQFDEWIGEAKRIAVKHHCYIIGTSHADGSYHNCGISIPIGYCIDRNGELVFLSKNDTTDHIIELNIEKNKSRLR